MFGWRENENEVKFSGGSLSELEKKTMSFGGCL